MEINEKLKKAIQSNKLVVFAGAGVSKKNNLPDWNGFVEELLKSDELDLGEASRESYVTLLKERQMTAIMVLDLLGKDKKNKKIIKEFLSKRFILPENRSYSLHEDIINLTKRVVTTNYDNAFEIAYAKLHNAQSPCIVIQNLDKTNLSKVNSNEDSYIYKLHGSCMSPDSCVIFTSDYRKIYEENGTTIDNLKMLFGNSTILFIGFSFSDRDINNIFDEQFAKFGENKTHFILTPESSKFEKYGFLETIDVDYDQIGDYLKKCIAVKLNPNPNPNPKKATVNMGILDEKEDEDDNLPDDIIEMYEMVEKVELFKNISTEKKRQIVQESRSYELNKKVKLCAVNDRVESFWLILHGSIAATKKGVITTVRYQGSVVGELGLLEGRLFRSSQLIAYEDKTKVVEIKLSSILSLDSNSQAFIWRNLASMLGAKIESLDMFLCNLAETIHNFKIENK